MFFAFMQARAARPQRPSGRRFARSETIAARSTQNDESWRPSKAAKPDNV